MFLNRKLKELNLITYQLLRMIIIIFINYLNFCIFIKKLLRGSDISWVQFKKEKNDKFYFKNAFINFLDRSYLSKDTKINIHKKVFDKERKLENDQKSIFEGEMIHVLTVWLQLETKILLS